VPMRSNRRRNDHSSGVLRWSGNSLTRDCTRRDRQVYPAFDESWFVCWLTNAKLLTACSRDAERHRKAGEWRSHWFVSWTSDDSVIEATRSFEDLVHSRRSPDATTERRLRGWRR